MHISFTKPPKKFTEKTHLVLLKKIKFSIKDFFSKCDQIRSFLRIWLHLLEKSLMENVILLCSVWMNAWGLLKIEDNWYTLQICNWTKTSLMVNWLVEIEFSWFCSITVIQKTMENTISISYSEIEVFLTKFQKLFRCFIRLRLTF